MKDEYTPLASGLILIFFRQFGARAWNNGAKSGVSARHNLHVITGRHT